MRLLPALALLTGLLSTLPAAAATRENCVHTDRIRAFAPVSDQAFIVREGRSTYRRITVAPGCPLASAERVALSNGSSQHSVLNTSSGRVLVNSGNVNRRFCTQTPGARVVVSDEDGDTFTGCPIASIEAATKEDFEQGPARQIR